MRHAAHRLLALLLLLPLAAKGQAVLFSHEGGFHTDTFRLSMHTVFAPEDVTYTIHYTFDGEEPTAGDSLYTEPLVLTKACYSRASLFRVQTVPDDRWFAPDSVERIVVVRAAAFDSTGVRRSAVTTRSYLIDSLLGRRIELPVVSLCIDSLSLFDHDSGLYIRGRHHDPTLPYGTGNYFQKGRQWERRAAFGYYDTGGVAIEQDCGLRMHGDSQRVLAQKGLSLYARKEYGARAFDHHFFDSKEQRSYRRLVLRPWKTSWSSAGLEDWLSQQLATPLLCDNMATRPVVLFINGEYWGIYFLEEKADEHYIEETHGVRDEDVDLLAYWDGDAEHGTGERWKALYEWLGKADLGSDKDYAYLESQVDVEALTDYMLLQLLVYNDDWPVNNVRYWSAPGRRWRWIFFDGDAALSPFTGSTDMLDHMTFDKSWQTTHSSAKATLLFRRLCERPQFMQRAMERMTELRDTYFDYTQTQPLLQQIVDMVEDEVPYQMKRFDSPSSMARWRIAVSTIDDFLRTGPQAMVDDFARRFGMQPPDDELLTIDDASVLHTGRPSSDMREAAIFDVRGMHVGNVTIASERLDAALPAMPAGAYFVQMLDTRQAVRWIVR